MKKVFVLVISMLVVAMPLSFANAVCDNRAFLPSKKAIFSSIASILVILAIYVKI